MSDLRNMCDQIKSILKSKSITQDEFAALLKVSSPTIKRWLRGNGLLFKDLLRMLDVLDVPLTQISSAAEGHSAKQFTYSHAQEQMLATEEGVLAFFDLLLKGKSAAQIARIYKLSEKSTSFYLSKLDKAGLIEWLPNNRAKLLVSGEPNWIKRGPLSQKFRKQIINEHILNYADDREKLRIGIYSISQESLAKANGLLSEVTEKVRLLEIKDSQSTQSKKLTTVILGVGQNEIPILSRIPNK